MPYEIEVLPDFLDRVLRQTQTPFTWVIGAGMSVSAGIPLAVGTSLRIILFEYISKNRIPIPWKPDSKAELTYHAANFPEFFNWFEASEGKDAHFEYLLNCAVDWLKQQRGFEGIDPSHPDCYPKLFQRYFKDPTLAHAFLTHLVSRTKGVNIAHLGLAGILKDYPERGHTVFTTNFDDLLLKALLSLNYTGRVFGDLHSKEVPDTNPTYPQIAHLHGRHTGYRLANTPKQISDNLKDDFQVQMRNRFAAHLSQSSLIVLGYSGWDDLVMQTLHEWKDTPTLLKGNLYWVAYQRSGKNFLSPQVEDFLNNQCPDERAFVIVEENEPDQGNLDSDSFMLALSHAMNERNKGFIPYRESVITNADRQYEFILNQLKGTDLDPSKGIALIKEALVACQKGDYQQTYTKKEQALSIVEAEGLDDGLRGQVFVEAAKVELYLDDLPQARQHLEQARPLLDKARHVDSRARRCKVDLLRYLAELYIRTGEVEEARRYLTGALPRYEALEAEFEIAQTQKLLGDIELRKGQQHIAIKYYSEALKNFESLDYQEGQANCHRAIGDAIRISKPDDVGGDPFPLSENHYLAAISIFDALGNLRGKANAIKGLGDLYLRDLRYSDAEQYYAEAFSLYAEAGNLLGKANIKNAQGDILFQQKNYVAAVEIYADALADYRHLEAKHGMANTLADVIACLCELDRRDEALELREEAVELWRITENKYVRNVLRQYKFISNKEKR